MPVRNAAPWVEEALDSVLNQTLSDLEVIVVDDDSSDHSLTKVRAVAQRDSRVRAVECGRVGIVGALETARLQARGDLLARMDADDVCQPRRLELQVGLMQDRPDVVLCGTPVRYFPRDPLKDGALRYESWINSLVTPEQIERDILVECPLAHPTFMARAHAVEAVGGYRDAAWPEDYDLLLRLWKAGGRFANTGGKPFRWREHPGRLSRVDPRYGIDAFRRLKVDTLLGRFIRLDGDRNRPVVICGAGPTGKSFQKLLLEAGVEVLAFVDLDPRKLGQDINGTPVVPPENLPDFRHSFCLGAVSGEPGRSQIRDYLRASERVELEDFVMVA